MALSSKTNGKTFLSQPPYNKPVIDSSTGFMSMSWRVWFDSLKKRLGDTYSSSLSDLEDSGAQNATSLSELKQSVVTIDDNVDKIDTRTTSLEKDMKTVVNQQDIDHESIVANAQTITEIKNSIKSIDSDIATIDEDIDGVKQSINNINNVLNKVSTVSSLPSGSNFRGTFVVYNNQLCFSFDGTNWVAVSTQAVT